MKNTKKLSAMAALSVLVLTGCGQEEVSMTPGAQTPTAEKMAPEAVAPTEATTTSMEATPAAMTGTDTTTNIDTTPMVTTGSTTTSTGAKTWSAVTKTEALSYKSPAGTETLEVSITVENGVITQASATPQAVNPISTKLQTAFAAGISTSLVGKTINGLKIDTVSGASLSTGALNEYLAKN